MTVEPTALQAEHCTLVQQEILEVSGRMLREGIGIPALLAGLSNATAAIVIHSLGEKAVPEWFARQACLSKHLGVED